MIPPDKGRLWGTAVSGLIKNAAGELSLKSARNRTGWYLRRRRRHRRACLHDRVGAAVLIHGSLSANNLCYSFVLHDVDVEGALQGGHTHTQAAVSRSAESRCRPAHEIGKYVHLLHSILLPGSITAPKEKWIIIPAAWNAAPTPARTGAGSSARSTHFGAK
ncbi:hypothetical protein HYPSUDRAFT_39962 [Hypholoma sublateritium FD-334 SS-4]|uniref:Uncharacterized protein n=1 Tax=Hypholoma sublateritium (strain FD-334 SS-4) TaxID=945553 RepID=A0A0D2P3G0_HYPSF|nr:hypothetical protein HYPSUDRAFT_39962 [Hypholoma sublateritium FD-334 SS-4]